MMSYSNINHMNHPVRLYHSIYQNYSLENLFMSLCFATNKYYYHSHDYSIGQHNSRTGVAEVWLVIWGLAVLSILIFPGDGNTQQIVVHCTTTWYQTGLSGDFVDMFPNWLQTDKQKTDRQRCLWGWWEGGFHHI
jgi:hypothetical protein